MIFMEEKIMADNKYGVINEVGDLGLGFQELNEEDQKVLQEQLKHEQDKDKK
jgi:hypothetical protein